MQIWSRPQNIHTVHCFHDTINTVWICLLWRTWHVIYMWYHTHVLNEWYYFTKKNHFTHYTTTLYTFFWQSICFRDMRVYYLQLQYWYQIHTANCTTCTIPCQVQYCTARIVYGIVSQYLGSPVWECTIEYIWLMLCDCCCVDWIVVVVDHRNVFICQLFRDQSIHYWIVG